MYTEQKYECQALSSALSLGLGQRPAFAFRYTRAMRLVRLLPLALPFAIACSGGGSDNDSLARRLDALGATDCLTLPGFQCLSLPVPLDHSDPGGPTLGIQFAIRLASGTEDQHVGVLVQVQGGPGYSGIVGAEDFSEVDPRIPERFDLVFFDMRGLFASGGLDCPEAAAAWNAESFRAATPQQAAAVAARAADFGAACVTELGLPAATLRLFDTAQAVEDLESFRVAIDEPTLTLYGLSYGTQYVQTYATQHPDHTRAALIDGVVDLTLSDVEFSTRLVRADNDVLDRMLSACTQDAACASAFPGAPAAVFDQIAATLDTAAMVAYPLPAGGTVPRSFDHDGLDMLAYLGIEEESGRTEYLRALASAAAGDYVPLLRDVNAVWVDQSDLLPISDPDFSNAGYYLFTCNDFGHPAGGQAPYLAAGALLAADSSQRVLSAAFGDLPCATWPGAPEAPPLPAPYSAPAPTMFINVDADVATPFEQGAAMYARLSQAGAPVAAVTVHGGHHVMLGYDDCVNQAAAAFLLDPTIATAQVPTECTVPFMDPFAPPFAPPSARAVRARHHPGRR